MDKRAQKRLYSTGRWQRLRLKVFERDGWRCVKCAKPSRLECHHRVLVTHRTTTKEFFDGDQLETLCRGCHIDFHRKVSLDTYAGFTEELL